MVKIIAKTVLTRAQQYVVLVSITTESLVSLSKVGILMLL